MTKILLFLLVSATALPVFASAIERLIEKSGIPSRHFGIWVQGPEKKVVINDEKLFIPASLSKIPTAGAALAELGLEYQYETKVWHTGTVSEGVLEGDLYLQGGGDPSVVSETYWVIINELKRSGIRKINGQLYVDDTLYDDMRFSDSRQSRRVDRAYDAPVGALSFNWNSVNVYVRPGAKAGDPARAFADPENEYIVLKNLCKTAGKTNITVERKNRGKQDIIEVHGTIATGEKEQVIYKSVTHPDLWAGSNFKAFMNQQGIAYTNDVDKKKTPADAVLLVTYKSKPLRDIVADMAKFSNNYVAEMLTKALAQDKPASLKNGIKRIHAWLEKMGWQRSGGFVFDNPSGFSNDNKVKPRELGELLAKIHGDFSVSPEFLVSLPVAGVDGTLKRRLKDMKTRVRAKTGFLTGHIGLAGYVEKNKQVYTFVFLYNGPGKNDARVRDLFDEFLRQL